MPSLPCHAVLCTRPSRQHVHMYTGRDYTVYTPVDDVDDDGWTFPPMMMMRSRECR